MPGKLILIGGVSRSGKSTLAQQLASKLDNSAYLEQDFVVRPEEELPTIQDRIDWDHPDSVDWISWQVAIENNLRNYDWVIAEGIFAFANKELNSKSHFTIELIINQETFLEERREETRWGEEPEWFLEHVWQAHQRLRNPHNIQFDLNSSRNQIPELSVIVEQIINK